MHRWLVLLALAACEAPDDEPAPSGTRVPYPAPVSAFPLGDLRGRIGRSMAPQQVAARTITGDVDGPLVLATPWTVPGDGPARAVLSGLAHGTPAVELVDVDRARVAWRASCAASVVGVTAETIVCGDAHGTRALGLDGKPRWHVDAPFLTMTGDRVATVRAPAELAVVHAATGAELGVVTLPAPITADRVLATCERETFATTPDGKLARVLPPGVPAPQTPPGVPPIRGVPPVRGAPTPTPGVPPVRGAPTPTPPPVRGAPSPTPPVPPVRGAPPTPTPVPPVRGRPTPGPTIAWATALGGTVAAIDACDGTTVLVTIAGDAGPALVALARDTGKIAGRVDGVRGYWPAREDPARLEIATASGVARWPRDLAAGQPLDLPALGELLARRGDRRLVRATPLTAALIDRHGVRAYVPLGELGAVLGDDAILAASWLGTTGRMPRLFAIPRPWRRPLRVVARHAPVAVPAELRDLPQPVELDTSHAIAFDTAARHAVAAVALDPLAPALYAVTLERAPDDTARAGLARFDLAARAWQWHRAEACGAGTPVGIAVARDVVACAARTAAAASVRAAAMTGTPMWEWTGGHVDAIEAAGDVVVIHDEDRLVVLDAANGHVLGTVASGDGTAVRAAALDLAGMSLVVTYEQGRVVAHLPRVAMVPAWSIAVAGVVKSLAASGDGVLVALEDGDAFRIDARTAVPVALPGLDLVWRAAGDLVTGEAPGGPVPPLHLPIPREPPEVYHPVDFSIAPAIARPWPPPPPMPDSWQYTLYELGGGLRARNDYALEPPITPAATRGGGASPLVIEYGATQHRALVVEPTRGDPVRHVILPGAALTFATVVEGRPVAGTILAAPLRVVVF